MTEEALKVVRPRLEALAAEDRELKARIKEALDQILRAEMTESLGRAQR